MARGLAGLVVQGVSQHGELTMVLGYTSVFLVSIALSNLITTSLHVPFAWRRYLVLLGVAVAMSVAFASRDAGFTSVALPVTLAVALPLVHTTIRAIGARWRSGSAAQRAFLVTCLVFGAHIADFAFLRNQPAFVPFGFALGMLLLFAFAITATAVMLEAETVQRARIATELDAARRIQRKLVPRDVSLLGLEVIAHVRPAETVAGYDVDAYHFEPWSWLLLGDVTGHGLGAGLVMLMAQSTISLILQTRPDISPRELYALANKILHANLTRLDEQRHMTIVAIRGRDHRFEVSGSHDNIYIYRAATRTVETLAMTHFPWTRLSGTHRQGRAGLVRAGRRRRAVPRHRWHHRGGARGGSRPRHLRRERGHRHPRAPRAGAARDAVVDARGAARRVHARCLPR